MLATPNYTLIHDAIDYDRHAASIATGEGFALPPTGVRRRSGRPPYPIFVAGVDRLVGFEDQVERVEAARLANALVGTGIVALIGLIALQLWGAARRWWRWRSARSMCR